MDQFTAQSFDLEPSQPDHESTESLLQLFLNSDSHMTKIYSLAKIKQQILCSLKDETIPSLDKNTIEAIEHLFSKTLLHYLKRNHRISTQFQAETQLFFYLVSLVIKHFFREEGFKELLIQVTDLVDRYSHRTQLALTFFTEVISTIEDNRNLQGPRCKFERHLINQHISSMLTLANFFLQKGLLIENTTIQDGHVQEIFEIVASQQYIKAAIKLIRTCLCFDWQGEKYNDFEEVWEMGCLVIPTKRARQPSQSQFQKWLKASQWVRLYSFLFKEVHTLQLKMQIVELLGDLARVHMKFFRNKLFYKTYIENIVYAFSQILESVQIRRNSQQSIQISLYLLASLNKLLSGSSASILFDINENLFKGLLDNLKRFIVYQIIGENTLNSNLIFYSFTFFDELMKKSRFERNKSHYENIQKQLRQISRSYEQYFRLLMNNIRKKPIMITQSVEYRMDYAQLRDFLSFYDYKELQIYFLPFRLMKPRYATTNTIHQVFIYICARGISISILVTRAMNLLQLFQMEKWEKQIAFSMVNQAVLKLGQKFGFTFYKKKFGKKNKEELEVTKLSQLPPISQHYEEQIDNEQEYCHMLRLSLFIIIDQVIEITPEATPPLSTTMIKLTSLTIQLCLQADLQEKGNIEWASEDCKQKISFAFQRLPLLCRKAFLREYQKSLYILQQTHQFLKLAPIRKRYTYPQVDLESRDNELQSQASYLLQVIDRLLPYEDPNYHSILVELKLLTAISLETQLPIIPEDILSSIENCIQCVNIIMTEDNLTALVHYKQKRIVDFLHKMLTFLDSIEANDFNITSILTLLRKLVETKCGTVKQEALNKTFVMLKCLLPFFRENQEFSNELLEELQLMKDEVLLISQQKDLEELGHNLNELIISKKQPQRMQLETTCLSFHGEESVSFVEKTFANSSKQSTYFPQLLPLIELSNKSCRKEEREKDKSESAQPEKEAEPTVEVELYDGFHRDKTMEIVNKYTQVHPNSPPMKTPPLSPYSGPKSPSKQVCEVKSTPKRSTYQIDPDTQFPEQPMEIQQPPCHDYVEVINEIVYNQHHFKTKEDNETQQKETNIQHQQAQEEQYIPLEPLTSEPETIIPNDPVNIVQNHNDLSTIQEGESIISSQFLQRPESPKKIIFLPENSQVASQLPSEQKKYPSVQEVDISKPQSPKPVSLSQKSSKVEGPSHSESKRSLLLSSDSSGKKSKEQQKLI